MNARRALALVAAVAMVLGALAIRRAIDDDSTTTTSSGPNPAPIGATEVVCADELAAVCDALGRADPALSIRVASAFTTMSALAGLDGADDAPVWVTVEPFPGMVDAARAASGDDPLGLAVVAVASTPLGVALPSGERLATLTAWCAGRPLWACVGDAAGRAWTELGGPAAWGTVRPALGKVESSATALVAFSAAVAGYFGTTDYRRSSWEADPGFSAWVRRLARTVPPSALSGATPLATMATRPSSLDVAATTEVELAALGDGSGRFDPQYPEPAMSLHAVIAAPYGTDTSAIEAVARDVLSRAGWASPGGPSGPSASTTLALVQLWGDAT